MDQLLAIVTSQHKTRPIVPTGIYGRMINKAHCSHGYLWTHDIEVGACQRDCDNLRLLSSSFSDPVFPHGASLVRIYANSERVKNWVYVFTSATQADMCKNDGNPLNSMRPSDAYMRH